MRPLAWIALLAAASVAACGGSSSPSTPSTVTVTASAVPATSQTTTTSVSAPARCVASDLELSFLGAQGATGHGELGFALRNVGGRSCHTYGYPGVLFLGPAGQPLPTVSTRTTHDFFGVAQAVRLRLAAGGSASFRLGVTHGIGSAAGCTTAHGLQVIAPDDTAALRTTIPGGAYECRTATVSPLQPEHSAYP